MPKSVEIYSTPTCVYCRMAKDYFKANGVQYTEYNVAVDEQKRAEMLQKSGQLGVPVIVIDNELFVGFNKPEIERAVKSS